MTTDQDLTEVEGRLTDVGFGYCAAKYDLERARVELQATVHKAWKNGTPVARIAKLAGLSRQGVYDILKR